MLFSFLSVFLVLQIAKFSAALFEYCDKTYTLAANGVGYVNSTNYPNKWPSQYSCLYTIKTAPGYEILAECQVNVDKTFSYCDPETFYISLDGSRDINNARRFCGIGITTQVSQSSTIALAYVSNSAVGSGSGGTFSCKLTSRPQACECGWSNNVRIVGGTETSVNKYPCYVPLYSQKDRRVFCGSSILNRYTVMTAAHCLKLYNDPSDLRLRAGDHNINTTGESPYERTYFASRYVIHPSYNPSTNLNDLALIITTTPIEFTRGVGPCCLPFGQTSNTFAYSDVYVMGYGSTQFGGTGSNVLRDAPLYILANPDCAPYYTPTIQSSQFCTYYQGIVKDSCQQDSGGPVICEVAMRQYILGLISYGKVCGGAPGVNTRITSFLPWIEQYSEGSLCKKPFS